MPSFSPFSSTPFSATGVTLGAQLKSKAMLGAVGTVMRVAKAGVVAVAAVGAAATTSYAGSTSVAAAATLAAKPTKVYRAVTTPGSVATVATRAMVTYSPKMQLTATATLFEKGGVLVVGKAPLAGASTLEATGVFNVQGDPLDLQSAGAVQATPFVTRWAKASLQGTSAAISVKPTFTLRGKAALVSTASKPTTVKPFVIKGGWTSLTGTASSLTVKGSFQSHAGAGGSGTSAMGTFSQGPFSSTGGTGLQKGLADLHAHANLSAKPTMGYGAVGGLSGTATTNAFALGFKHSAASLGAGAGVSVTGKLIASGAVGLVGTAGIFATLDPQSSPVATSDLTATPTLVRYADAPLGGAAAVGVSGVRVQHSFKLLRGEATVGARGSVLVASKASLTTWSSVFATMDPQAALEGAAGVSATARIIAGGAASFQGTASQTAKAAALYQAASLTVSSGVVGATGKLVAVGQSSLETASGLTAGANPSAHMRAYAGNLTATGVIVAGGAASLVARADIVPTGSAVPTGAPFPLVTTSSLHVTGVQMSVRKHLTGQATVQAVGQSTMTGAASLVAGASVGARPVALYAGQASLNGTSQANAWGIQVDLTGALLAGVSQLVVTSVRVRYVAKQFEGGAEISGKSRGLYRGKAHLHAGAMVTAAGTVWNPLNSRQYGPVGARILTDHTFGRFVTPHTEARVLAPGVRIRILHTT